MTVNIREFMDDALSASYDPTGQYRASLRTMLSVMDGQLDDISPANPVVYTLENQAALIAAFTETLSAETNRLLQVHATNREDLYPHMADVHYTNVFATPASSIFTLVLEKKEIMAKMIPTQDGISKKLTIARNTYFTISDYVFGIHYPIDIIEQVHGGLRVVYDMSESTHLQRLSTNTLVHRFITREDIEYIAIDIPVFQFKIRSKTPSVTLGTTFNYSVDLEDEFYACRVWRTTSSGEKVEMKVIHASGVYDPANPTACIKLLEGRVNIEIPQIYINQRQVIGELRVDVYTTKGPLDMMLDAYPIGSIGYRFRDLDKKAVTQFMAPMNNLSTCTILAEHPVTGGTHAMTFEELRASVIKDALGDPNLPITPARIQNFLSRKGYDIVKNVDLVTDRIFLAAKNMPKPDNPKLLTAANASIETINVSFDQLIGSKYVLDNDESITVLPNAIYQLNDGMLKLVSDLEIDSILAMRRDLLASHVSRNNFLYCPYHYVLDKSDNQFRVSPYYLDSPKVESQTFVEDNERTLLQVSTAGYGIEKVVDGYVLRVSTSSNDAYKALADSDLRVVLGFISPTEKDIAWMVGDLVGTDPKTKERVFEFKLVSRYSINKRDHIDFRNFKMYDLTDRIVYSGLDQEFILIYGSCEQTGPLFEPSRIDSKLPRILLPYECVGVTEERLKIHLGQSLDNLWAQARSVASSIEYEKYEVDVILRYEEDVFQVDPATGSQVIMVNNIPQRVRLHKKGDPILTPGGLEQVQYPKGTIKLDPLTLEPIVKNVRYLKHRFDVFLIEGVYAFSNDEIVHSYKKHIAKTVAYWITHDLIEIEKATMDNSRVFFYPKTVFGNIDVNVANGIIQQVEAAQKFKVDIHIPHSVARNEELKEQLKRQVVSTISEYLTNRTLSNSEIVKLLRDTMASDIVDVQVSLFGADSHIPYMEVVDEVTRCGIKKRLIARDDDVLMVEEDITIVFMTV